MQPSLRAAIVIFILSAAGTSAAQTAADYAVQIEATVQTTPQKITLNWKKIPGTISYTVARKAVGQTAWTPVGGSTDSTYTDTGVVIDSSYEYRVTALGGPAATGYIYAGIRATAIHSRGAVLVLVDSLLNAPCAAGIAQLCEDLRADGYAVIRRVVKRTDSVTGVKAVITASYAANSSLRTLYLLGHIPVPYSGNIYPDGHPDHEGAWPADVFYGDMDGIWTDATVNNTVASRPENDNVPGDKKWDQDYLPSDAELAVGRVDFANMPVFGKTEAQMMNSYLARAHSYKVDSVAVRRRGLIDDNFGAFGGEAFAANAWRAYAPLLGRDSIRSVDFISTLDTASYQWAYGCGGGSYTGAGGIGATSDFATKNVNAIFTMTFGSYFGDWDAQNNFLRAPLCSNVPALTNCWAGRPNWFMHTMGMGESIGSATRLSQNNGFAYSPTNYAPTGVHTALMGDPALRLHYGKKVTALSIVPNPNGGALLTWTTVTHPGLVGYYVYRSDAPFGAYSLISPLLNNTTLADTTGTNGKKFYMVRPAVLQTSPSGGYYNLALGTVDSAVVNYPNKIRPTSANIIGLTAFPNPGSADLQLTISAARAQTIELRITNAGGAEIMRRKIPLPAGGRPVSVTISAGSLSPGIYFITAGNPAGALSTIRWIKR